MQSTQSSENPNRGASHAGAPRPQAGQPEAPSQPHQSAVHPLVWGPALGVAQALALPSPPQPPRLPHVAAITAAPTPALPPARIPDKPGDGKIVLAGYRRDAPNTFEATGLTVADSATLNLMAAPPSIAHVMRAAAPLTLRADIARPELSPLEAAGSVLRALGTVGGGERAIAAEVVARALSGGSSVSWLAAGVAAAADWACHAHHAYPDVTPAPGEHWLAEAQGIPVEAIDASRWAALRGLGAAGEVVLRATSTEDVRAALIAAIILRGASGAPAGDIALPSLRRTAWSGVQRLVFLLPPGSATERESAAFAAGGWRALLPDAATTSAAVVGGAFASYALQHGLERELGDAIAAVSFLAAAPDGKSGLPESVRTWRLPRPYGTGAILADLLVPSPAELSRPGGPASLPATDAEWVAACAIGPLALYASAAAMAREAGADPFGIASGIAAAGDLAAACARAGGQAALLGQLLESGYGLAAPFGPALGPYTWAADYAPAAGDAPCCPRLERTAAWLFGCGATADISAFAAAGRDQARAQRVYLPGVGHGLLAPAGAPEAGPLLSASVWSRAGVDRPEVTAWVGTAAPELGAGGAHFGWQPLPAERLPRLRTLAPRALGVTRGLGLPAVQANVPLPSALEPTGEVEVRLFFPTASAVSADRVLGLLRADSLVRGPSSAHMCLGAQSPTEVVSAPPPSLAAARPRRLAAFLGGAGPLSAAPAPDAGAHIREALAPTPSFGAAGPEQPAHPAGPAAPAVGATPVTPASTAAHAPAAGDSGN